jgi:hypothetical protein
MVSLSYPIFFEAIPLFSLRGAGFTGRRQCRSPKGEISKKIPPKLRSGLFFEALRPLTNRRMSPSYLGNLPQSLKDQTTGKEQNRYHLEEIDIAAELAANDDLQF